MKEARQRGLTGYFKNGKVCTFENPPADEHSVHLVERILGQVLRRNNQCTLHVLQSPKVLPTALLVVMISTILQYYRMKVKAIDNCATTIIFELEQ